MKKILILGTGNAQVDLAKYCKDNDFEVYGCSYTKGGNAEEYLDHFVQIDIVDSEKIADYAKENQIRFIYSIGSDIAMPTVCSVSQKLGLPYLVDRKIAKICNTKTLLREALGKNFEGNVCYQRIRKINDDILIPFPVMMKPVDSQGQRGVAKISSESEFNEHFDKAMQYSRKKELIIEEYIDGPEVSVNAFRVNGKTIFSLVTDRDTWEKYPGGIIHKHIVPSKLAKDVVQRIVEMSEHALTTLHIDNGPAYLQVKLNDKNEPKLIEITPRLDGCHMWRVIKEYCGIDLLKMTIDLLTEESISDRLELKNNGDFILEFMCEKPGNTCNYGNYNFKDSIDYVWYYKDGEEVRPMNGYMEKCGYLIRRMK